MRRIQVLCVQQMPFFVSVIGQLLVFPPHHIEAAHLFLVYDVGPPPSCHCMHEQSLKQSKAFKHLESWLEKRLSKCIKKKSIYMCQLLILKHEGNA